MTLTLDALVKRINRKLAPGEKLIVPRHPQERAEFGDYYIADTHTGNPMACHQDPEDLGRELGVLRATETVC